MAEKDMENAALAQLPAALAMMLPDAKDSAKAGDIIRKFMEEMGGGADLGTRLAGRMKEVITDPMVPHKEARQWFMHTIKMVQQQEEMDKNPATGFEGLSDQDLKDLLRPLAIDLLRSDREFLRDACEQAGFLLTENVSVLDSTADHV